MRIILALTAAAFFMLPFSTHAQIQEMLSVEKGAFLYYFPHEPYPQDCFCNVETSLKPHRGFVASPSIGTNIFFNKRVGIQLGFQYYRLRFPNKDFVLVWGAEGGFESSTYHLDSTRSILVLNNYFESPLQIIYDIPLDDRFRIRLSAGGSPVLFLGQKKIYTQKATGEQNIRRLPQRGWEFASPFASQFTTKLHYSPSPHFDLFAGLTFKWHGGATYRYGGAMGISSKLSLQE